MLTRLEMKLKSEGEITYPMVTLFHGALMEIIPEDYASYLHVSQLHPYTQHLEYKDDCWYWIVCCLNTEATKVIIQKSLMPIQEIEIKNRNMTIQIIQKTYQETSYRELMDRFYEEDASRYIQIHFISPTAFKQRGHYLFYPDIRCIYQSLMNKYDAAVRDEGMIDDDTLEQLCEYTQIVRYDLKSVMFSLEGVRIPSFIGKITLKISKTQTMANFARLLFQFGTFAGVGIKASLGMGCIKILEERGNK